jgi:putative ABC transport system substrate-binding protein
MRRRDFTVGLLLAAATQSVQAQERAKQHRIAIVTPAGPVALISETGDRSWQAFFKELRRLGDVEGQNLTVERYSGEGRPAGFADLAREVVNRNPDVIVAITNPVVLAVRAATETIPIVWIGVEPIRFGFATSLAHPRVLEHAHAVRYRVQSTASGSRPTIGNLGDRFGAPGVDPVRVSARVR